MITIIDYGLGNIRAFLNAYRRLNIDARTASSPRDLPGASKLILPGVGSFDHAMERLTASGMRGALDELVLERRVPVLGICVGMQILGRQSDEGTAPGLGWVAGAVKSLALRGGGPRLPLPHMGWNDVRTVRPSPLLHLLGDPARFYFLHSYYFQCDLQEAAIAVSDYGGEFACAINTGNIFGVQFHPEKSHRHGTQVLKNFAEI